MIINLWSKKVHPFTCQLLVGNGDAFYECKAENCLDYSAGGNSWGLQHSHEMFPLSVCLSLQGAWRSFQPLQLLLHKQLYNDFSYTEPQWWRILNWKKRFFKWSSITLGMLFTTRSVSNTAEASFVINFHKYLKVNLFPKITSWFIFFAYFQKLYHFFGHFQVKHMLEFHYIIREYISLFWFTKLFLKVWRILKKNQYKHFITGIFLAKSVSYLKILKHSL